ncbi:DUF4123 domain-containing protein [Rhodovulum sulfidophilum]|nr:DUF4123 domain-containing protein [Rhodovulum sulfidophilum]
MTDDFWSLVGNGRQDAPASTSMLHHEIICKVTPLDRQLGRWPKISVPEALQETLFSDSNLDSKSPSQMLVYALLDSAASPELAARIEDLGEPHCCLFQGAAAVELRDVAPWLVQLNPKGTLTRQLFSDSGMPMDLWSCRPGIFLRSQLSLPDLRGHLRRLTRVQSPETKRWSYFRFWEPDMISAFLLNTDTHNLLAFFQGGFELHLPDTQGRWHRFRLASQPETMPAARLRLTERDRNTLRAAVSERHLAELFDWVRSNFETPLTEQQREGFLERTASAARSEFATGDKRILAHCLAASWMLGETAWTSSKITRDDIELTARGALQLYERSYALSLKGHVA